MEIKMDLSVKIGSLKLKNPVLTASGTFGFGEEFHKIYDINMLGGIITKSVTLKPRIGNKPPRIAETENGMINSIGLANPGLEGFINNHIPFLKSLSTPVIVNIAGDSIEEYCELVKSLTDEEAVSAFEINISCPNVDKGGMFFGVDEHITYELTAKLKELTEKPLIIKLTPNVTDITKIALSAERGGATALSLINTALGMAIDIHTRKPKIGNLMGGLSGPGIKPIAIAKVFQTFKKISIPIIGIGGICNWEDAVEFIIAGALAIQLGTINFIEPLKAMTIVKGIEEYMKSNNINDVLELRGDLNDH